MLFTIFTGQRKLNADRRRLNITAVRRLSCYDAYADTYDNCDIGISILMGKCHFSDAFTSHL